MKSATQGTINRITEAGLKISLTNILQDAAISARSHRLNGQQKY